MHLRPENYLALEQAHIPNDVLLHVEELPVNPQELLAAGVEPVLVDHNRLLPQFGTDDAAYRKVKAIIDHHEDEGVSKQADPRLIKVPNGSTTSLVTTIFEPAWKASLSGPAGAAGSPVPPEVATLLLSALVIDTQGLKPGGKATQTDVEAAEFLYPLSTLPPPDAQIGTTGFTAGTVPPALLAFSEQLIEKKFDVSGMSEHDLLLRDYKEYAWDTQNSTVPRIAVGLCTVPVKLETVLSHEGGWEAVLHIMDAYMAERAIDVCGIATTFKSSKGKGKRELLLSVRAGGALPDMATVHSVMRALAKGLADDVETFDLLPWRPKMEENKHDHMALETDTRVAAVWKQGNARSTRKQLAPAMHRIIAGLK